MQLRYGRPLFGEGVKPVLIESAPRIDVLNDASFLIVGFLNEERVVLNGCSGPHIFFFGRGGCNSNRRCCDQNDENEWIGH